MDILTIIFRPNADNGTIADNPGFRVIPYTVGEIDFLFLHIREAVIAKNDQIQIEKLPSFQFT